MQLTEKISTSGFITQELPHQQLGWCQLSDQQQNLIPLEEMSFSTAQAGLFAAANELPQGLCFGHICLGLWGLKVAPGAPSCPHGEAAWPCFCQG